jgi:hypothetical protein
MSKLTLFLAALARGLMNSGSLRLHGGGSCKALGGGPALMGGMFEFLPPISPSYRDQKNVFLRF